MAVCQHKCTWEMLTGIILHAVAACLHRILLKPGEPAILQLYRLSPNPHLCAIYLNQLVRQLLMSFQVLSKVMWAGDSASMKVFRWQTQLYLPYASCLQHFKDTRSINLLLQSHLMTSGTEDVSGAQGTRHNYKQVFLALLAFYSLPSQRARNVTSINSTSASAQLTASSVWCSGAVLSPSPPQPIHGGSGNTTISQAS